MKNDPKSHGLWEATAPLPPILSEMTGDIESDVVVVGAGFTGISAALHLAERGVSVVVLEAVEVGFGGSGRNVGLVNAGMWLMPDDLASELGSVYGQRLIDQLGEAPSLVFDIIERYKIACEPVRAGTFHCAVGRKGYIELAERARQWQVRGAPVELLDAHETERRVGTGAYAGSLLDHRAGTVQPLAYVRGLASAAVNAGAVLHTCSPVQSCEDRGDRWRLTTPKGRVTASSIILASNAYSIGPWSCLATELVRLPYFNMATQPLSENIRRSILPERQGVWDTEKVLSSFRFDDTGRLIFGSVGALRGPGARIHRDWGRRALRRLFPQLADIQFEQQWYGAIGMTSNSLPRFHQFGRSAFSISGYNGRGIAPGTTFGRDLACLITGEIKPSELALPLTHITRPRLRSLQEGYYEVGAQVAHALGAHSKSKNRRS